MRCGPSGFLSSGDIALKPCATTSFEFAVHTTNVESFDCYQLCAVMGDCHSFALVGLERLFSPLYSLCCCCLVSGKRGCSNLHCFACWLMCLWERAQCEVNSCASQYHCIPLFSASSLSVCYSALVRTKLLCWRWCHCLLCENLCVPKIVIIELSWKMWRVLIKQESEKAIWC